MSDGYGPPRAPEVFSNTLRIRERIAWGVVTLMTLSMVIMGISVRAMSPAPGYSERIDPSACEYVLTSDRSKAYMNCPIPSDIQAPNWPHKTSPLNGGEKR